MKDRVTEKTLTILGLPDDQGVKQVGGRVGASAGPARCFQFLGHFRGQNLAEGAIEAFCRMIPLEGDLEANHEAAKKAIDAIRDPLIVIGGGNDYAAPWLAALSERHAHLGCINVDAHFDLRSDLPQMTSGSPFFRAIERKHLDPKRFTEFGIQSHCNAPELWAYAHKKGIRVVTWETLRSSSILSHFIKEVTRLERSCHAIALSIDLDACAQTVAPGVSAPQAEGLMAADLIAMVRYAATRKKIVSIAFFEYAPSLDVADATGRLLAQAVWHYASLLLANGPKKTKSAPARARSAHTLVPGSSRRGQSGLRARRRT